MPVIRLKTVVLPAPFGPITLMISRGQILRSTSCTAASPPKRLLTLSNTSKGSPRPSVRSTLIATSCPRLLNAHFRFKAWSSRHYIQRANFNVFIGNPVQFTTSPGTRDEPFWTEDHQRYQNDAKDQVTDVAEGEAGDEMRNACIDWMQETGWIRG